MLYPAQLNGNFERQIGHEIFVKTEKTEYLSNQLTYAHFNWKFIFLIKFGTSVLFIFWISLKFLGQLLLKYLPIQDQTKVRLTDFSERQASRVSSTYLLL